MLDDLASNKRNATDVVRLAIAREHKINFCRLHLDFLLEMLGQNGGKLTSADFDVRGGGSLR